MYRRWAGCIADANITFWNTVYSANDIHRADIDESTKRNILTLYWAGARIETAGDCIFWRNFPRSPLATLGNLTTHTAEARRLAEAAAKAIQPRKKLHYSYY